MPFVPMRSVRVQMTLFVLLAILLSWMVSGAVSSYLVYQNVSALRQQMLTRPDLYPNPIPPPRITAVEILVGPQQVVPRGLPPRQTPNGERRNPPPRLDERQPGPPQPNMDRNPPPDNPRGAGQPGIDNRPFPRQNPRPIRFPWPALLLRAGVALLMALFTGMVMSRRFTRPLTALADGAKAYQAGKLDHRIPLAGEDEFAEVAEAMNGMAQRVSRQISTLEDDAARRRHLLADVAHELRGPVTTMRTMAGALAEGVAADPERHDRAVQSLVRTSDRMLHLVTDLLELAKLDLRELPLHLQPVDLRELAEACVQNHQPAAQQAEIILLPVESGPPLMVQADPDRITQVVDNLLNNAISYAGAGAQIKVQLAAGAQPRLAVTDNGQGISARHLPYVFDPFYRADNARTPGEHSGLGLRIARGLLEAHGGTLTLESREGEGTRAVLTFPAAV
ncbi:MAG: HAMP domain-containing sensor histidine kinase [Armatimonadota bacterium]